MLHAKSVGAQREDCNMQDQVSNGHGSDVGMKRARLADNSSVADCTTNGKREMEMEVDQLRAELAETKQLLRERTVEVEKSTQLFTMFD